MKIIFIMLGVLLVISQVAYAHEKRLVANQYEFVVGFVNEPAFSKQLNGIDLRVSRQGQPLEGLEKTLHVSVFKDDQKQSMDLPLKPRHKDPGRYAGYFLPTQAGKYNFVIKGTINGTQVDEQFIAGGKIHEIEDVDAVSFPK